MWDEILAIILPPAIYLSFAIILDESRWSYFGLSTPFNEMAPLRTDNITIPTGMWENQKLIFRQYFILRLVMTSKINSLFLVNFPIFAVMTS